MPFNPGNKRAQRARNVPTVGGPMKFGLYPTVGVSLPFLRKLEKCCSRCGAGVTAPCGVTVNVCAACNVDAETRAEIREILRPLATGDAGFPERYCRDCCGDIPLDMTSLESELKKALCAKSENAANLKKFADEMAAAAAALAEATAKNAALVTGTGAAATFDKANEGFSVLRLKVFLNEAQAIAKAKDDYATAADALVKKAAGAGGLEDVADTHIAYVKAQIAFAEAAEADKAAKKTAMETAQTDYNNAWKVVYGPKTAGSLPKLAEARDTAIGDAEKNIAKAKLAKNTTEGLKALRALL